MKQVLTSLLAFIVLFIQSPVDKLVGDPDLGGDFARGSSEPRDGEQTPASPWTGPLSDDWGEPDTNEEEDDEQGDTALHLALDNKKDKDRRTAVHLSAEQFSRAALLPHSSVRGPPISLLS